MTASNAINSFIGSKKVRDHDSESTLSC